MVTVAPSEKLVPLFVEQTRNEYVVPEERGNSVNVATSPTSMFVPEEQFAGGFEPVV
jgi:hypothetical protein